MVTITEKGGRRPWLAQLGADLLYVLPGFPIATFAFVLLVTLFSVSVSTLVIWIGAMLLPLTLFAASGFAEVSRARVRFWGARVPAVRYRQRGAGLTGLWRWVADPRRWVDLVFETLIAFPLRIVTFSVALTWICIALGGLSWWAWALYLPTSPGDTNWPGDVLMALTGGAAPEWLVRSYVFETVVYLVIGAAALVTLPFVMRWLALLDATVTVAALGGGEPVGFGRGSGTGHVAEPGHVSGPGHVATTGQAAQPRHTVKIDPTAPTLPVRQGVPIQPPTSAGNLPSATNWGWIASGFAAAVAIAVGWPLLAVAHGVQVALAMVVIMAQAAALTLAMRFTQIAIALATLAPVAAALLADPASGPWPWPITMLIVQAILVLLVALRAEWPWAVAAWFVPQLGVVIVALFVAPGVGGANLIVCASVSATTGAIGVLIRLWSRNQGALREAQAETASLDERQQRLTERNRVARELHDVVAHSMSVISVQATTAKYRLDGVSEAAAEEFEQIAASSRVALGEMRGLLATLRDGEASELAPQPGIQDLAALVADTRRAGAEITLEVATEAEEMPPSLGLTSYRMVQEGLSNAVRHAPGAAIAVRLTVEDGTDGASADAGGPEPRMLVIEVANGRADDPGEAASQAPGAGAGLAGVRDRARALGGGVTAGPNADGGFTLRAALPLAPTS